MAKPEPPFFPDLHPNTPFQQLRPQIEAYRKQVEAFYNSLKRLGPEEASGCVSFGQECWRTEWEDVEMSDKRLKEELSSGRPSAAALALLRKKANL